MAYSARILADSTSPAGVRITTLEVTFPRMVLAEFNTHRMFSRNSASSRAIPVAKLIERVLDDPAMPVWWGKYQKGMSAAVEMSPKEQRKAKKQWLKARDNAVKSARKLLNKERGLHKQITNRLLEPWMWQTVIVTATDWSNFFALRCDENAQPEIRFIAEMMQSVMSTHPPTPLDYGQWHLPLVREEDRGLDDETLRKVSTGRCARVSYLTHDGRRDIQADVDLHDSLITNGHMSPCEHQATPTREYDAYSGNFRGWLQYRKTILNESDFALIKA